MTLGTVLASLAEGATIPEILADFPHWLKRACGAATAFAAAWTHHERHPERSALNRE